MPLIGPYPTQAQAAAACGSSSSSSGPSPSQSSVSSQESVDSTCIDPSNRIPCCPYPTPAWPSSITVTIIGTKTCGGYGPGTYVLTYDPGWGYWVLDPSLTTGPGMGVYCGATSPTDGIIAFIITYVTIEGVCGCQTVWTSALGSCDPLDATFRCPFGSACNDFPPFCGTTPCTDLDWVIQVTE